MQSDRRIPLTGALARAGWLATTLALAAALLVSSWMNYRAARAAVETLNTGQAEILTTALRSVEPRWGLEGNITVLESVLAEQGPAGLRYIAVLERDGSISTSVGEASGPVALPPEARAGGRITGPILVPHGDRVRAFVFRLGGGPPPGFARGGRSDEAQGAAGGWTDSTAVVARGGILVPQFYMLEFDPVPASNVVSQAVQGLVLNGFGALALTLVAIGFFRMSVKEEAAQRELEQQRRLGQLGEMSAVLAHEIRNPLASLKGNAHLLAEGLDDGSRERRRADRVVDEAKRLETLTTDLLDFARSSPVGREDVDPVSLVRSAAEQIAGASIAIDASEAPARWRADPARLEQALVNLLRNAWQISPADRAPVATVRREAGDLVIEIRDFGPGLAPGDEERIFEPFYTTRTQGTGLGLPVAKRAVELHGGTIVAGNHPDGGAVFRISIPA